MKIKQAMSSAILVVLLTAPMAWAQDNIRAAMEAANKLPAGRSILSRTTGT